MGQLGLSWTVLTRPVTLQSGMKKKYISKRLSSAILRPAPSRDLVVVAHQEITREWWEEQRRSFDVYVSQVVLDEVDDGAREAAKRPSI
jgi:hypothetical protein